MEKFLYGGGLDGGWVRVINDDIVIRIGKTFRGDGIIRAVMETTYGSFKVADYPDIETGVNDVAQALELDERFDQAKLDAKTWWNQRN